MRHPTLALASLAALLSGAGKSFAMVCGCVGYKGGTGCCAPPPAYPPIVGALAYSLSAALIIGGLMRLRSALATPGGGEIGGALREVRFLSAALLLALGLLLPFAPDLLYPADAPL
jgi:hypothetical protein